MWIIWSLLKMNRTSDSLLATWSCVKWKSILMCLARAWKIRLVIAPIFITIKSGNSLKENQFHLKSGYNQINTAATFARDQHILLSKRAIDCILFFGIPRYKVESPINVNPYVDLELSRQLTQSTFWSDASDWRDNNRPYEREYLRYLMINLTDGQTSVGAYMSW